MTRKLVTYLSLVTPGGAYWPQTTCSVVLYCYRFMSSVPAFVSDKAHVRVG